MTKDRLQALARLAEGENADLINEAVAELHYRMAKEPCSYFPGDDESGACPTCGGLVHCTRLYCEKCGQKLEWHGKYEEMMKKLGIKERKI